MDPSSKMLQWWNTDKLLSPKDVEKLDSNDVEDTEQDIKKSLLETSNEGLLREWRFRVRIECLPGELVCVTGNAKSLGHWHHDQMLELKKEKGNQEENIWVGTAGIPVHYEVEYRYCICVTVEPEGNKLHSKQFIIRQWESFSPRIIKTDDVAQPEIDMFGYHEDKDHNIGRGWLTSATVVQLKLFNNPIQLWKKKLQGRKIHVKVTPVNLITTRENELSNQLQTTLIDNDTLSLETFDVVQKHWPITEVAVLNAADRNFSAQGQFGHLYEEDDFMIFQIQLLDLDTIAYLLDFYTYSSQNDGTEPPYHIGFTCILPSIVSKSEGRTVIPITSTKHQPIGQITIEYLVIRPLTGYTCTMQDSMQTEWKDTWRGLDVGHRGIGSSFSSEQHKCADVRENTIASLKSAASHGADFVEFDVQLSRDYVPVLYHDFFVCISMKKKKDLEDSEMLQLPLKDLTLEQLHLLKLYHVDEGKSKKYFDEHLEEHQPFPTLKEALQVLDPHVGFNVEIKWTMQRSDGTYELNHPFDLNLFVDVVLKDVLKYAGSRPIVFSCFHPDICAMVQLKQNRYPVMFLTQCITPKYPPYYDPRCQSVPMAVHFSVCSGLLGINVHTEELLRDKSMVNFAKTAGLVLFCWGEDNNDTNTIKQLKEMGLHGVIYDKIDKFSSKEVKESIFRLEARESERNLIKAVAEQAKEDIGESQPENQPGFRNYLLDIEKVHCVSTLDSASTSSGLSIWSVDQFGNPSDASFEPPSKSPKDHIRYCKGSIKNTPDRRPI